MEQNLDLTLIITTMEVKKVKKSGKTYLEGEISQGSHKNRKRIEEDGKNVQKSPPHSAKIALEPT